MSAADDDLHTPINSRGLWEAYMEDRRAKVTSSTEDGCETLVATLKGVVIGRFLSFAAAPGNDGGWVTWMSPPPRR